MSGPEGKKITIITIAIGHEQYCLLVKTAQQKEHNCIKGLLPDPRFRHNIWLMHRKLYVATSAVFFSKDWVPRQPQLAWVEFKRKPGFTCALGRVGCSLKTPATKRWKWLLRWALCKWPPRRKNKAAARKSAIPHRMSKSKSKTHLSNFGNSKWGFHGEPRIEKLLYSAILHGKPFELASRCLVSKALVTFAAFHAPLSGSQSLTSWMPSARELRKPAQSKGAKIHFILWGRRCQKTCTYVDIPLASSRCGISSRAPLQPGWALPVTHHHSKLLISVRKWKKNWRQSLCTTL